MQAASNAKGATAAQQILSQAGKSKLLTQLKDLPLARQLSQRDLSAFIAAGRETQLKAGEPILKDNLAPTGLTVLLKGKTPDCS